MIHFTLPLAAIFDRPVPGVWNAWPWLIIPLCAGVSVVYKVIHTNDVRRLPIESFKATLWILLGMTGVAAGLWVIVEWVNRS
jgi:hypothetical protein